MNIQEKLYKEITPLYAKLEKELPRMQEVYTEDELTTFMAQCGDCYPSGKNEGIIFYGRSNNGWDSDNPLTMNDVVCELRRPFFNLMRKVSEHFYPKDWNKYVTWSNICKVVPASEGNPTESLWDVQYDFMTEILRKEMDVLSPKVVIMVTGNASGDHWDAPLFEENDLSKHKLVDVNWADNGRVTLYKKDERLYLITDRPEFKPIDDHADSIIRLIEKYK